MNPSALIRANLNEIQLRIIGHTRAAEQYLRRNKILGFPIMIMIPFTSSTIMMSIAMDDEDSYNKEIVKYVGLFLSILSFILSASQNYLNYIEKYQSHELSSKLYTTLLRSMELRLIEKKLSLDVKRTIFKEIVDQMSIIEQYEDPVPIKVDKWVRSANDMR